MSDSPPQSLSESTGDPDGWGGPSAILVGKYLLHEQIGEGGMGVVFEAEQQHPRRRVALKLMKAALTSRSARERFLREADHLARLQHAHIAQVYDAGTHRQDVLSIPYFVMELVQRAKPITAWADERALSIIDRMKLVAIAAHAVQHAHAHGVAHRDLKPGNVLVSDEGVVKVIDFGLARLLDPLEENAAGDASNRTIKLFSDDSVFYGTPPYMSPEQFSRGDDAVPELHDDTSSDVYALGVLLYELLCGRLPFVGLSRGAGGGSALTFARTVLETEPPRPRSIRRDISDAAETIILRCLEKRPADRYATAGELADDLHRAIANQPIHARSISRWRRTKSSIAGFVQRHTAIAVVFTFLATLVGSINLGSWVDSRGPQPYADRKLVSTPALMHFGANTPFENVRLVKLVDDEDYVAVAAGLGLDLPIKRDRRAARALHGLLMKRLADENVKARVVVFDIYLMGASEFDSKFIEGARALYDRGIGVVCGALPWDPSTATPETAAPIAAMQPYVTFGGLSAIISAEDPPMLHLTWKRGNNTVRPSIALAAWARAWYPPPAPAPQYEVGNHAYAVHDPSGSRGVARRLTALITEPPNRTSESGIQAGDLLGQYYVEVPSDQVYADATHTYAEVLNATPAQLHQWFDGRAVMIADARRNMDPPRPLPDGRSRPGFFVIASAIEHLLDDKAIMRIGAWNMSGAWVDGRWVIVFCIALVASMIGAICCRRHLLRVSFELVVCLAVPFAIVLMYKLGGYLGLYTTPALAAVVCAEIMALVWRAAQAGKRFA